MSAVGCFDELDVAQVNLRCGVFPHVWVSISPLSTLGCTKKKRLP